MDQELPSKKDVCLALLEQSVVRVFLDPRREGVTIPVWLKKQPQLLLDVGLNMPIPIPDLHVGEDALTCTLSFNRAPFFCVVPWTSVFALVGDADRGMIWPDDVPTELQIHAAQAPAAKPERPRPQLSAVPNIPSEPAQEETRDAEKSSAAPDKGDKADKADKADKVAAKGAKAGKSERPAKADRTSKRPSMKPPAPDAAAAAASSDAAKPAKGARKPADRLPKEGIKPPAPVTTAAAAPVNPKDGALKKKRELPPYLRVIK